MFKLYTRLSGSTFLTRLYATKVTKMKYLNVAEKNDAAKTIAGLLSNGSARRREGLSVYNKIYEFETTVRGSKSHMVMTSVSGHLLQLEFLLSYKNWNNCDPLQLFDAAVRKQCNDDFLPIKKTLEREVRSCQGLIIWTDCDREGENIGFEIVEVCKAIKPGIAVYRAKFSEITSAGIRRALTNLAQPDKFQSDAVNVRMELDLRTGAAITRFQTMRLQRLFPEKISNKLISYGSCQIPTLGFVAERYKEVEEFVSEPFWKIKVTHTIDDLTVDFNWARNRLFDKEACEDYLMLCLADPKAKVENVVTKPKNKWRPTPMDTVELEKLGSRKLKLSAKETMTIAEKLYTQGILSYPRTETNMFSKEINLKNLVEQQLPHSEWGAFAQRVVEWGPNPRNGNKTDQAHPPIHPLKLVTHLTGNEARVYELVVRHFLACVSKDATGSETTVSIDIAGEKFTATGLCIFERNYLDVYIYEKWNARLIHKYEIGQIFDPTDISMAEGATTAPPLLTEADLIALMEKHGIGTDATHAEHINTIKERGYIGEVDRGFLVPGVIGMGLYEGYNAMELALSKPMLRAEFEADLKKICLGEKDPKIVLREQIQKYKEAYKVIIDKIAAMDEKMSQRLNETPRSDASANRQNSNENQFREVFKCPKCRISHMALKKKKDSSSYFIGCLNFPDCKNAVWLPDDIKEASVTDETCPNCRGSSKMLKVKLNTNYYRQIFDVPDGWYKTCLRCDSQFCMTFNINADQIRPVGPIVSDSIPYTSRRIGSQNHSGSGPSTSRTEPKPKIPKKSTKSTSRTKNTKPTNTITRAFAINSRQPASVELNAMDNVDNFFDNDGFDEMIASADIESVVEPAAHSASANTNDDLNLLLADDSFDNYAWGSVGQQSSEQNQEETQENRRNHPSMVSGSTFQNGHQTSNEAIRCTGCHQEAKMLIVKKEGPNKGRSFYACPKPNACKFFQWADENPASETHFQPDFRSHGFDNENILCKCEIPANRQVVRKEGPNQGRWFYSCSNRNKSCGFFKWAESNSDTEMDSPSFGNGPSTSRGIVPTARTRGEVKTRKCGICRKEGHTRSKCPQNSQLDRNG